MVYGHCCYVIFLGNQEDEEDGWNKDYLFKYSYNIGSFFH